ncbi:MAG: hypothetical protein RL204_702 [Bacteroidota bacterium]
MDKRSESRNPKKGGTGALATFTGAPATYTAEGVHRSEATHTASAIERHEENKPESLASCADSHDSCANKSKEQFFVDL